MEAITINGKEIKTNINNARYPRLKDSMNVKSIPFGMSDRQFLEEMVEQGYTKVTFYEMPTCVRGYHHIYANCR